MSVIYNILYFCGNAHSFSRFYRIAGKRKTVNFEKVLGVDCTARAWKVVDALIGLASGEGE